MPSWCGVPVWSDVFLCGCIALQWCCVFLSPPALRWVGICGASCGGFSSVPLPAAPAVFRFVPYCRFPFGGSASFLPPSACPVPEVGICLWCFEPCSSYGTCGFTQLNLPQVPLWGFLLLFCFCLPGCSSGGVVWAAAFSMVFSVLLLCRLACHCLVFCTLCWGSALEVVSSLCMAFWWFLMAPHAFRA